MARPRFFSLRYLPLCIVMTIGCFGPFYFVHAAELPIPMNPPAATPVSATAATPQNATCEGCAAYETAALQKLLTQYKALADNGGWPAWKEGRKIRTGESDPRIPALRQILTITGDYRSASGISTTSTVYDATLSDAVKRFQARHGLNVDGDVTKSTQAALSVPVEARITQIAATLERLRENPVPAENKFILVNLPAYTLYAVDNGAATLTMRVIVGSRRNHTPLFDNEVTDVVFNPPWSVPPRIARNEMIPKLRKNPSYFVNAGFIVTQDGVAVDPMSADPDSGGFSFRQRPGSGNALGKIKFNIPDKDDIYLHSTSTPKLFAEEDRALSHGCIRLEKPRDLAHFVMGSEAGWSADKIDRSYDSSTQKSVRVTPVAVHLVYWTAYVDAQGTAHFYNDMYDKDEKTVAKTKEAKVEGKPITVAAK